MDISNSILKINTTAIKNYQMKKIILFFISIFLIGTITHAQTPEQYVNNFKNLIKEAELDFKNVLGKELETDEAKENTYYACTKGLSSSLEAICINHKDNSTYFGCKYEYDKTEELIKANQILPGIIDEVNAMIKSGKYKGRDYNKTDIISVTEVTDLDGNYIIDIESNTDTVDSNKSYLKITVYGKSWGKK